MMFANLVASIFMIIVTLFHPVAFAGEGTTVKFGQDFVVHEGETIDGGVLVVNGNLQVDGTVQGDAIALNGSNNVRGHVGRDAVSVGGVLYLFPTASIGRDAVSVGGTLIRDNGSTVGRRVTEGRWDGLRDLPYPTRAVAREFAPAGGFLFRVFTAVGWTLFLVLAGALAAVLFPNNTRRLAQTLAAKPGMTAVIGILTAFLAPLALLIGTVLLAITVIGILIIPLFYLGVLALGAFGLAGLGLVIGERAAAGAERGLRALPAAAVIGMLLLALATAIPLVVVPGIGLLLIYLAGSVGLAIVILSRLGTLSPGSQVTRAE
jgi:hypothetical protein